MHSSFYFCAVCATAKTIPNSAKTITHKYYLYSIMKMMTNIIF